MSDTLIIKKYPNRRLYNMQTSSYITLDDVRDLVRENKEFKVIDARSASDMTNYVLLQIISEEEAGKFPLFSTDLLQNIIRYYDSPLQKSFTEYLEKGFSLFKDNNPIPDVTFSKMTQAVKDNVSLWQESMNELMGNLQKNAPKKPRAKKKSK